MIKTAEQEQKMPGYLFAKARWFVALCLAFNALPPPASAQAASCSTLFQNKAYLKAATCFENKANAMGKTSRLSKIQRYLKGQALRNAALSYKNAAEGIKNIEIAAYRRSLALTILQRYLGDNLCQRAYLCKLAKGETLELINLINYTQLSIVTTPEKRAFVEITGYKFKVQHISPPQWNQKVRPGRYKITVKYEGVEPIPKEIIAPPGQSVTITMLQAAPPTIARRATPPPPPPGIGPVPWLVGGVGLAIAITGGVMLGLTQVKVAERDKFAEDLRNQHANTSTEDRIKAASQDSYNTSKQNMDNAHNAANTFMITGWILAGVGVATIATGITLAFVLKPKPTPPSDNPKTSRWAPPQTTPLAHTLLVTF